jgi:sigma-B regulation protein RsbU (phosphoserine phosphatase)
MPDGRLGLFLGDASGHGIAPAIVVSQARTLVRALAGINCDPAWLLSSVNARLTEDLELGRFVTAFLGCLASDGSLSWCSAGQGPMLLKRSASAPFEVLEPLGPPIGVVPELRFDSAPPIRLDDGGTLVVISDGIFESRNESGEMMDLPRVIALLSSCEDAPPAVMLSVLRQAVRQWQGREEPLDDQTAVIVQRTNQPR